MTELDYFFTHSDGKTNGYQLIWFSFAEPWRILLDGELLCSIEKTGQEWKQISGEDLPDDLFKGISRFIESQYFNTLPSELLSRWPKLIDKVVVRSDRSYLIVCKTGIAFKNFERIFARFVPGLLKDEWPVNFQVYDHDFSDDFMITVKPEKGEYKSSYQHWNS